MKNPEKERSSSDEGEGEDEDGFATLDTKDLPEDLASSIEALQGQLRQGELDSALESLAEIKTILSDADRFS